MQGWSEKCMCDYWEKEETEIDHQPPSVWSPIQHLDSRGEDDHQKRQGIGKQQLGRMFLMK